MKRSFSIYCFQTWVALSVTIASGSYAGEHSSGAAGQEIVSYEGIVQTPSFTTRGGVICGSNIIFSNNGKVLFRGNSLSSDEGAPYGGAIESRTISLQENGEVIFDQNAAASTSSVGSSSYRTSDSYGGAICSRGGNVSIEGNESVSFTGNASLAKAGSWAHSHGGALYSGQTIIRGNGTVVINGNTTTAHLQESTGTASANGGGIYSTSLQLNDNGSLVFSGNTSTSDGTNASHGGALFASMLEIRNNASVVLEKNAEIDDDGYRLRSIHAKSSASISAAAGASVVIKDSIFVGGSLSLNKQYVDASGNTHMQTGDIVFSGASTEKDLLDIKGSNGTETEILLSRTSEVTEAAILYGGRLILEEGAVLQGAGLTLAADADATLQLTNSSLYQTGYTVGIYAGNTLSTEGTNILAAETLAMEQGCHLQMTVGVANMDGAAILTTTGQLSMDAVSLNLLGTEHLTAGEYKLLTRTEGTDIDISGWTLNGVTSDQLRWEDGTLYYTGGHDWNHGVTDDDDINDLAEILGNLIINGGDITLEAVVGAIQDAVDAGFGHGQGHIVINRGGIHISGAGDLDGHIIFNGELKDIRKLFIEKDITNIKIELGGGSENENIVDVDGDNAVEITSLTGDGGLNKTGEGEMVIVGNGHEVGGTLSVQDGQVTFTVEDEATKARNISATEIHELVVGNDNSKQTKVKIDKHANVKGDKLLINSSQATVTNEGSLVFSEEIKVTNGKLDNQGCISKVTLEGGKLTGSGIFDGLDMLGGELVVGNSPGLQIYTNDAILDKGSIIFSLADADTAATAETKGWKAAAYSTIDMQGNKLTLGEDIKFVIEIGGAALETLTAQDGATLTFNLTLIQNIHPDFLILDSGALAKLLGNTAIAITCDAEGLSDSTQHLAGKDITYMLYNAGYSCVDNALMFSGTLANNTARNMSVPEPTTATLSLLALAGLAARSRRR